MAKRKLIQYNLIKNSISAYFAAIEIHNKPNFAYRYETVTLLMINAWELALKAYVRKYIKERSIFADSDHTIGFDKALDYVTIHRNGAEKNSFTAIKENLLKLEEYRDMTVHFYSDEIEPYIFMLVARAALNYVNFIKHYFNKDIMADEGLFIMPLGFKLPFRPEDFLSDNAAKYAASPEARKFIKDIVDVIQDLNDAGIEDSIVLGFDIYLESVKKVKNSDILAAITTVDKADATFAKVNKIQFSPDADRKVQLSDGQYKEIWPYTYADLVKWCRENISEFKQNQRFNDIKRKMEKDPNCCYMRKLEDGNPKSAKKPFYSERAFITVKEMYEEE